MVNFEIPDGVKSVLFKGHEVIIVMRDGETVKFSVATNERRRSRKEEAALNENAEQNA